MINLTKQLLEAKEKSAKWERDGFALMMSKVENLPSMTIRWDETVPENWVGLFDTNRTIGILSFYTKFPLMITTLEYEEMARKIIGEQDVLLILYEDVHAEDYSIDAEQYLKIFPDGESDAMSLIGFRLGNWFMRR